MIGLALLLAAAQPAETPRQFIAHLYARYEQPSFSPLDRPQLYFSPALTAAIRKDSSGDEVGYLDGDPLCGCQDFKRIRARVVSLRQASPKSVDAAVHVDLGIAGEARDLRLQLVLTPQGWRIADVISREEGSLAKALKGARR